MRLVSRAYCLGLSASATLMAGCMVAPMQFPRGGIPSMPTMPDQATIMNAMMEAGGNGELPADATDETGIQVVFQTGHTSTISAVAVSKDGRYIVSAGEEGIARIWDVASGQEIRSVSSGGLGWAKQVGFTADDSQFFIVSDMGATLYDRVQGNKLLAGSTALISRDGHFRVTQDMTRGSIATAVIDNVSGTTVWKPPGEEVSRPVALSADGRMLLVFEPDAGLQLWRQGAKQPGVIEGTADWMGFGSITLSPSGRWFVMEDMRNMVKRDVLLFDTNTRSLVRTIVTHRPITAGASHSLLFSPDERTIAYSTADGVTNIWGVTDSSLDTTLVASAVNYSEDGTTLVLGKSTGGAPFLRDAVTGKETPLSAGASNITGVALLDDEHALLAASSDGKVREWNLANAEVTRTFGCGGESGAWSVAASTARPLIAIGCMDGKVLLLDRATGNAVATLPLTTSGKPAYASVAFTPDGHRLAVASGQQILVWDVDSGTVAARAQLPPAHVPADMSEGMGDAAELMAEGVSDVRTLAFDAVGSTLAIGRIFDVWLVDAASGRVLRKVGGPPIVSQAADPNSAFDKRAAALMKRTPGAVVQADPRALVDAAAAEIRGAQHLAFSIDGQRLFGNGVTWDLATGREIAKPMPQLDLRNGGSMMDIVKSSARNGSETGPVGVSPDGRFIARAAGRVIRLFDAATDKELRELKGHRGTVQSIAFSADGEQIFSGGQDGSVRLWSLDDGHEIVALTALGSQDFVAVTPDQFYRISKAKLSGVAFRKDNEIFPFEQFDLRFNRPDIVMERIGVASPLVVRTYRQSWQRRLKKLGFTEESLKAELSLPVVTFDATAIPVTTHATSLSLTAHAQDPAAALDRFNVFVNDVPVYGRRGLAIPAGARSIDQPLQIPLAQGRNRVQVSVLNANGVESLRQTVYTTSDAPRAPPDVWVVAVGVSKYQRSQYSLRYAAKDAADVAATYQALGSRTHVLTIADADATRKGIEGARQWLEQAKTDDLVVVFAAGHGMTDSKQNYYFGTYDIDPEDPGRAGLPFETFENLLDGIAPLRKLLLVDTCFSGEIDKEDTAPAINVANATGGTVVMRSFGSRGVKVVADEATAGTAASVATPVSAGLHIQQDLFADLRRGTGAVVISSASGSEFALEGEQWNNGVFTYALLNGIRNRAADANADGEVTVGELQNWVTRQVVELTHGGQNPTVRRENLAYDFPVF